jgi:hypothetical protein
MEWMFMFMFGFAVGWCGLRAFGVIILVLLLAVPVSLSAKPMPKGRGHKSSLLGDLTVSPMCGWYAWDTTDTNLTASTPGMSLASGGTLTAIGASGGPGDWVVGDSQAALASYWFSVPSWPPQVDAVAEFYVGGGYWVALLTGDGGGSSADFVPCSGFTLPGGADISSVNYCGAGSGRFPSAGPADFTNIFASTSTLGSGYVPCGGGTNSPSSQVDRTPVDGVQAFIEGFAVSTISFGLLAWVRKLRRVACNAFQSSEL